MKHTVDELKYRDTALALTFLLLLLWLFTGKAYWVYASMGLLILAMILPKALAGPSRIWFGFSHLLGVIMSRVILSLIFFIVVTPVALVRKVMGKDALGLAQWNNGAGSVFIARDHTFSAPDLDNPY